MAQVSYSFCMAMLHSFWQAALLMLLYQAADRFFLRNNTPLVKRNFLFAILISQVLLFTLTFFIFFSGSHLYNNAGAGMAKTISDLLRNETMQLAAPWIFILYITIISYKLLRSVYSWTCFKQQFKYGLLKPAVDLKLFTEQKAYHFGIKRKVKLWLSTTIHTPITFGFFKPVILLPVALVNNISTRQAETLIIHELTHIRTNDYLLNWFLLFTESIFFFNPVVSSFCSKIRMEREKNCDMGVMAFEYSPALYAETLLLAERMKQLVPSFQLAAVNRKKQLLDRIRFFSGPVSFKQRPGLNMAAPVIGLFLLIFFSSAILFQSGNVVLPSQLSTTIPYLPFNSNELPATVYANSPFTATYDLKTGTNEAEKQIAVAEAEVRKLQPLIKNPGEEAEIMAAKKAELTNVFPVAILDNDAASQIIIQEESSGSRSASVKTYSLRFENGQWILEPVWSISAKEIPEDSLMKKMDSSDGRMKRVLPPQQ